ncbi:hypothetical protein [Novosphingobium sp. MBES04]|uniref:hypothetical protein n=1 Tax=Novosphingobium sp. MBES04 TaxID=1206458 RepID=UPI0005805ABC
MRAVDHRLALGNRPALPPITFWARLPKKIIGQRQLTDLGMQRSFVDGRFVRGLRRTEHASRPFKYSVRDVVI